MYLETAAKTIKELLHEGLSFFNNKKYQEAIQVFSRLLDNDPANADYLWHRGQCWKALKFYTFASWDFDDARELYTNEHDQKKCQKELADIEHLLTEADESHQDNIEKHDLAHPANFQPLFDKAIFLHLLYNYTKLSPKVPIDSHIEDLPRIKVRQICQAKNLRPDLSPGYKLYDLVHLTRDLDHISLVVNFNNTKSQITAKELEKFNEINGEYAAEDLIIMLQRGIMPPTRAGSKQFLLREFAKRKIDKPTLTDEELIQSLTAIRDEVPERYQFTRLKLARVLHALTTKTQFEDFDNYLVTTLALAFDVLLRTQYLQGNSNLE